MPEPFTLTVPVDARYRMLAPDVAGKYAELNGGTEADAAAFAEALSEAITELAGADDGEVALKFRPTSEGIDVHLACGGRTSVLRHRFPARKS